MPEKNYPSTVSLKKIWVGIALVSALSLAVVILLNLYHSGSITKTHQKAQENHSQTWANPSDRNWYQHLGLPSSKQAIVTTARIASTHSSTLPSTNPEQNSGMVDSDRIKAMSAPINSNQMVAESPVKTSAEASSKAALKNPSSPYIIQAGTLIPGILITGINSDLPGQIISQVRSNVYDSVQGRYLLIPQGSKLIGVYDAKIIYGQERVLVAWQRLILPNGQSMDLSDMAGVDNSGYAGFTDQVNAHYSKLLGSAVLMSVLGAGVQLSQPQTHQIGLAENSMSQALSQNIAGSMMSTASALTEKNLNVQPTLEIRPGFTFNVSVTKDLVFPKAYQNSCEVDSCVGMA